MMADADDMLTWLRGLSDGGADNAGGDPPAAGAQAAEQQAAQAGGGGAATQDDSGQTQASTGGTPAITASANKDGSFSVSGTGFLPGHDVRLRAVDDGLKDEDFHPQTNGSGAFKFNTPAICVAAGAVHFSATDGRPAIDNDDTGFLWSNTVTVQCAGPAPGGDDNNDDDNNDDNKGGGGTPPGESGGGDPPAGQSGGSDQGGNDQGASTQGGNDPGPADGATQNEVNASAGMQKSDDDTGDSDTDTGPGITRNPEILADDAPDDDDGAPAHRKQSAPVNLFPASLQTIANNPSTPAKPAPPPDGVLARAGDGRKFWRPAGAGATSPVAGKDWLEAFLRFYRAGPPQPADPNGMNCSFNGATMAVAAALDIVDAQATLGGYKPSRPTAGGLLQDLIKEGAENQALGDQLAGDMAGGGDVGADADKLDSLPMPTLLGALDRLQDSKKFERFADRLTKVSDRLGAAILTVRGDFDAQWQGLIPKLNEDDRAAILMRAPAKIRKAGPGPAARPGKEEQFIEPEAVVAGGQDGIEVQVKLTAHSPLGNNIGETEFTAHIGANGKISQFELDVTAFQQTLMDKGSVAEITATVSGNATIDMDDSGSKIKPGGINAQVKAELAARLTRVKVLKGVTVKLTGTYGTDGPAVSAGLEFAIPGT